LVAHLQPERSIARRRHHRSASLISACIGVADNALDKGTSFAEGHELAAARSARIPPGYVGMMLSRKEAAAMLDRIEGN
jgi:hypothetical protein